MDFDLCTTVEYKKRLTVTERQSSFSIHSPVDIYIRKVKVDGCLIGADQKKCDYIFELDNGLEKVVIYLELKGRKLELAIEQLESTIEKTLNKYRSYVKKCYVVSSKVPSAGPDIQNLRLKYKKRNIDFNVKTKNYIYNVT